MRERGTLWREAFAMFERLGELDAAAQQTQLDVLALARPDLHPLIAQMLKADARAESAEFMGASPQAAAAASEWKTGDQVGPYRLERALGSGGMGEVWLAKRADGLYDMPVALKLLHPHFARSGVRGRFLREGRILGRLSHPHIAHLLDAGVTDNGQLYLAIEHVEGEPLDQWCEGRHLAIDARLRLMLQVCDAVAHAHTQLIVHRDLKPSNILVDKSGEVKLLDFGIAKLVATDDRSAELTELTQVGGRVFTPQYAAPEQISGLPVTVATDVYALGMLLYGLLCGQRPYGHTAQTLSELEREVLEVEPPAPSRVVASPKLRHELAGDLDTIVLKALKKNPAERYSSVAALAEDLRRYLEHQPVLARPDSFLYRAGKYMRRHRVGVGVAALAFLLSSAGVAGVLYQSQQTRLEARKATAVKDFLVGIFEQNNLEDSGGADRRLATAEQLLDRGAKDILGSMKDAPEIRAELLGMLASLYSSLQLTDRAQELGLAHVAALRQHQGKRPSPELAAALGQLGTIAAADGRYEEAERDLTEALVMMDQLGDHSSMNRVDTLNWLGFVAYRVKPANDDTADRLTLEALRLLEAHHPGHARKADLFISLSRNADYRGDYVAAETWLRKALALGGIPFAVAGAHQQLGDVLRKLQRHAEAETELREAIRLFQAGGGTDHPYTADARRELGRLLGETGRLAEAATELGAALATIERTRGSDDLQLLPSAATDLASVLYARGEINGTGALLERSLNLLRQSDPDGAWYIATLGTYARVLQAKGQWEEAEKALAESRVGVLRLRGAESRQYALAQLREADYWLLRGQHARAAAVFEPALTRWAPDAKQLPAAYLPAALGLAEARLAQGKSDEAIERCEAILKLIREQPLPAAYFKEEMSAKQLLARALRASGRAADARAHLAQVVESRERIEHADSPWLAQSRIALAEVLIDLRETQAARKQLQAASDALSRQPDLGEHLRRPLKLATARLKG